MTNTTTESSLSPEETDLERRVLAHERILQSLIAYMSRTDYRFVDHLKERFVAPMAMARREHDHRDADDYAEEFIRAVIRIGETPVSELVSETDGLVPASVRDGGRRPEAILSSVVEPDRVQLRERGGIWELRVDGAFWGDYHKKEHALAAEALANLSLR